MSKTVPTRETARAAGPVQRNPLEDSGATLDDWASGDDGLRKEMAQLLEENRRLLGGEPNDNTPLPERLIATAEELELVWAENTELRARLGAIEKQRQADPGEASWRARQSEYEALLEDKSEIIRTLHQEIQQLRKAQPSQVAPAEVQPKCKVDLNSPELTDLKKFKAQLDEERKQLEADEEALMAQLRQMEMQMSKDRADLARQRAELQRLKTDLQYEIEVASRDSTLRDRLAGLQRRQQDPHAPAAKPEATPAKNAPRKDSGFLGRLFGGGDK